jgi:hypothetical protein
MSAAADLFRCLECREALHGLAPGASIPLVCGPCVTSPVVKRCGCGRAYSARQWERLHYVGRIDDCGEPTIELRNCMACGSSIAIEIGG